MTPVFRSIRARLLVTFLLITLLGMTIVSGYLIWALPDYPVAIDGRTNLYGDERLARSMATWEALPGWADDPDLKAAGLVIADRRRALTEVLRLQPKRWQNVFEDERAVVFVRLSPVTPSASSQR